jgi:hypothetical protein
LSDGAGSSHFCSDASRKAGEVVTGLMILWLLLQGGCLG